MPVFDIDPAGLPTVAPASGTPATSSAGKFVMDQWRRVSQHPVYNFL